MAVPVGGEIKKGRASLVGGIAVGLAVLCLWVLIAWDLGAGGGVSLLCGVLVAAAVAAWIRLADL